MNQIAGRNQANQARKRENFGFGAGLSLAPPVRPADVAPEYRDYFPHPYSEDEDNIALEEMDDEMSISSIDEYHQSKKAKGKGNKSMF